MTKLFGGYTCKYVR